MMPERREMIKTSMDSLLLCLINSQPMYGYQIIKELESRSQGYFKFKEGTVYPALHRLEESGLIEGKWQATFTNRQRKRREDDHTIRDFSSCLSELNPLLTWAEVLFRVIESALILHTRNRMTCLELQDVIA